MHTDPHSPHISFPTFLPIPFTPLPLVLHLGTPHQIKTMRGEGASLDRRNKEKENDKKIKISQGQKPPTHCGPEVLYLGFINKEDFFFSFEEYTNAFYRESVRSLLSLARRAETLRSIVRSPISTMSPPRMSGLT